MKEEWRTIKDFPDYAVSNLGRVKRINDCPYSNAGRVLKQSPNEKGYLVVGLMLNCKKKTRKVHLLVAREFMMPCPFGMECNHIDGIKAHNWSENLEWTTHAKNIQHAFSLGLSTAHRGETNGRALVTAEQAYKIKAALAEGRLNLKAIGAEYGVHKCTIHAIKAGRNWAHIIYP